MRGSGLDGFSLNGVGGEQSMMSVRCMRANTGGTGVPEIQAVCASR